MTTQFKPTITKLNIDTRYSNNNSTTTPMWLLPRTIDEVNYVCPGKFVGVNTITNVRDTNNKVNVKTFTGTTGTSKVVSIPAGNYTIDTFKTAFETSLATTGNIFDVSLNTLSNTMTIASTSGAFAFQNVLNDAYYEIGMNVSQLNATTASLTCAETYDLSGLKTINVVSDSFGCNSSKKLNSNYNILCSIPVDDTYASMLYSPESTNKISCDTKNLNMISTSIFDERMRPINDMRDWSMDIFIESE